MSGQQQYLSVLLTQNLQIPKTRQYVADYFLKFASEVASLHGISSSALLDPYILHDLLTHLQRDLKRFDSPDEFKMGGYLCFWIRKLKPFGFVKELGLFTNEAMALAMGLSVVGAKRGKKNVPDVVWASLIYDLRYRPVSPSVIANQFHLFYS